MTEANTPPHIELTEQFELCGYDIGTTHHPSVRRHVLGRQLFWVSNLAGYSSIAFVCSFCGNLWGRRHLIGNGSDWLAWLRPCEAHGGGSLLDIGDFNHIGTMPRELMEYELSIFKGD